MKMKTTKHFDYGAKVWCLFFHSTGPIEIKQGKVEGLEISNGEIWRYRVSFPGDDGWEHVCNDGGHIYSSRHSAFRRLKQLMNERDLDNA